MAAKCPKPLNLMDRGNALAMYASGSPGNTIAALHTKIMLQRNKIRVLKAIFPYRSGDIAMFNSSFAITAAALLLAAPAVASAAEAENGSFTYQGVKYDYTAEQQGDVKVLKGSAYAGKVPFELRVTKRAVTGRFNGRPVSFDVKDVKPIASKAANAAD
ncbi:MAG: hypothetical protein RIS85_123 [Pseudomonadota bacterium]|jgi:hypothetical protein